MTNIHHVHEVLEMMAFANQPFTRTDLETEIKTTFGSDACFANCADQSLNSTEVIDFIIAKNKVVEEEGLLRLFSAPCSH